MEEKKKKIKNALRRVIRTVQKIVGCELVSLEEI